MKSKKLLLLSIFGLFVLIQSACKKDKNSNLDDPDTTYDLSSKQATSDALTEDANNIVFGAIDDKNYSFKNYNNGSVDNGLPPCAVVTVSGSFPYKMITINFGSGCVDTFGVFRSGIIHIELSDSVRTNGSTARVTFDNYHVNKFKKEGGSIIWTNQTPNNNFLSRTWSRNVQNIRITDTTDGRTWLHSGLKTITQYEGVATPRYRYDDKYKIYNGSGTVTNSSGTSMTTTIIDTLHKSYTCPHIDRGSIRFDRTNHYAVLNYGNGTCDAIATVVIDGNASNTRTITLP